MALTKTPFFGLGSSGSVGRSITAQKRGTQTLIRQMPLPAYRRTLPQLYQRWLYEDYAYLWTQQSLATRQSYQSLGSLHHLTGFQYWMKYNLTNMPDIAAIWHLDKYPLPLSPDSSKGQHTLTLFGPSYTDAVIADGLLFDGVNDYGVTSKHDIQPGTASFTMEAFVKTTTSGRWIVRRYGGVNPDWGMSSAFPGLYMLIRDNAAGICVIDGIKSIIDGNFHHVAAVLDKDTNLGHLYVDGELDNSAPSTVDDCSPSIILPVYIGTSRIAELHWDGIIDNLVIYTRALDATEIKRHSDRRYPS